MEHINKQHWEQNRAERCLARFERAVDDLKKKLNKKSLTKQEIDSIDKHFAAEIALLGNIDEQMEKFTTQSAAMDRREFLREKHNSAVLARNMRIAGKPRPGPNYDAHHIVAGKDGKAVAMRRMLAIVGIRIDDAANGVWLVNYEKNHPHFDYSSKSMKSISYVSKPIDWSFPVGICHAWLNHKNYHSWLEDVVFGYTLVNDTKTSDKFSVLRKLRITARLLQNPDKTLPREALRTKADTAAKNAAKKLA